MQGYRAMPPQCIHNAAMKHLGLQYAFSVATGSSIHGMHEWDARLYSFATSPLIELEFDLPHRSEEPDGLHVQGRVHWALYKKFE